MFLGDNCYFGNRGIQSRNPCEQTMFVLGFVDRGHYKHCCLDTSDAFRGKYRISTKVLGLVYALMRFREAGKPLCHCGELLFWIS